MVDARAVERDERLEQVGAVALQQVQRHPSTVAKKIRQGLLPRTLQQQRPTGADLDRSFQQAYEPGALQAAEHLGLDGDALRRGVVERDLEHALAAVGEVLDQQADSGRARPSRRTSLNRPSSS